MVRILLMEWGRLGWGKKYLDGERGPVSSPVAAQPPEPVPLEFGGAITLKRPCRIKVRRENDLVPSSE